MEPQNNQPQNQTPTPTPSAAPSDPAATSQSTEKDEKYAAALMQMASLDYKMQQRSIEPQKHFIPKKWIISAVVSLAISLIIWAFTSINGSNNNDAPTGQIDDTTTQKLLDGAQELEEATHSPVAP